MPEVDRLSEAEVRDLARDAEHRLDFWASFLRQRSVATVAEVGVYRGEFASRMLTECPSIERYYMIDPWRHLDDWNKPANQPDDVFEEFHDETMAKTEAQAEKRIVLRGRTTEVVDRIPDGDLDLVYIDGDHTLRGITIDLLRLFPKVKEGGFVAGDDFCRNIFQHQAGFEPTLVFPYAVYFAEAVGARIYALPYKQFVMQKVPGEDHAFVDLAGGYDRTTLDGQIAARDRKIARQRREQRRRARETSGAAAPAGAGSMVRSTVRRLRSR